MLLFWILEINEFCYDLFEEEPAMARFPIPSKGLVSFLIVSLLIKGGTLELDYLFSFNSFIIIDYCI